jgi:lipoate-protein ligase A
MMSDARLQARLLPYETLDGVSQMALDQALLESVSADPRTAAIRTYAWSEPTLSLGYFQTASAARDDARWAGLTLVRRSTGGGAILHDQEITYAVAVPRTHPATRRPQSLYRAVHGAITTALARYGVALERRGPVESAGAKPFLCFLDHDPEDLVIGPHKVVGSAQRRRPGAVLEHGSILLARSTWTPELPGITEITGQTLDPLSLAGEVSRAIGEALDLSLADSTWTTSEREAAAQIAREVFGAESWTTRR